MNPVVVPQLLNAYGILATHVSTAQKGYRNTSYAVQRPDNTWLNVMIYKSEPDILDRMKRAHIAADILAKNSLPVRQLADSRIMKLQSGPVMRYAAIYNYLPGETIPWEAYTKDHIKLLGMAMSTMHAYLVGTDVIKNSVCDEYAAINKRMMHYFSQAGVQDAMWRKLHLKLDDSIFPHFARILHQSAHLPNQQILHMDLVRGNVLFAPASPTNMFVVGDTALTGIIDFEKVAYGHPTFDIARTLAFLLVDCKRKPADKVRKYFLQSGYNKRGKADFRNVTVTDSVGSFDLLDELVHLFLVYDFYKFLRHNPYEPLHQNEHFVRTRDALAALESLQLVN